MQWQLLGPRLQTFANACGTRIHQHRRERTACQPRLGQPGMKKLRQQPGQALQQTACADGGHLTCHLTCRIDCGVGSYFSQQHRFCSILLKPAVVLTQGRFIVLLRIGLQGIQGGHLVVRVARFLVGIACRWWCLLQVGCGIPLLQGQGFDHWQ